MHRTRSLLSLALCAAFLVGCLGAKATTPPPDATAVHTSAPDTAPSDTPDGGTPVQSTTAPTDTPRPALPTAASQAPQGAATPVHTPAPQSETPYAGGRLGYDDGYVSHPQVAALARELGYDPGRAFAYVRDEIGYQPYPGLLRGPLGTLWDGAGNAPDQAALLYALLRESGIEARFALATLEPAGARSLLEQAFPPLPAAPMQPAQASGEVGDPLNDPDLLSAAGAHVWVQRYSSQGWIDLDPSFAQAQAGERLADPAGVAERLPDELYHRLEVRVRLERITAAGLEISYPLQVIARVADLVGERIEFRHALEAMGSQGGMEAAEIGRVIGARQRRYQPVLRIGDAGHVGELFTEAEGLDLDAPVGRLAQALGDDSEEAGPLSGEWIEFTLTAPDGTTERFERSVFDRLGPAARSAGDLERLQRLDVNQLLLNTHLAILIAPCRVPVEAAQSTILALLTPRMAEHENLLQHLAALREQGIEAETRRFVADSLLPFDVELWAELAYLNNLVMAAGSDAAAAEMAKVAGVSAAYVTPRVLITDLASQIKEGAALRLDLRRDMQRAIAYPGIDRSAEIAYGIARGMMEAALEGASLSAVAGSEAISAPDVFAEALAQGIPLAILAAPDPARLEQLALPSDVKARNAADLREGLTVIVPERFVLLPSEATIPRVAWWRIDPQSGETVGVMDSGLHQSLTMWENILLNMYLGQLTGAFNVPTEPIDVLLGFDTTLINFAGNVLGMVDAETPWSQIQAQAKTKLMGQAAETLQALAGANAHASMTTFLAGASLAVTLIEHATSQAPE